MAKFKKIIATPNTFLVSRADGSRSPETLTTERFQTWAVEGNRLLANGNKIPAPRKHNSSSVPVNLALGPQDPIASDDNLGWWESFTVEDGNFVGVVDIPDDAVAAKIGKTITDTSVWVTSGYEDGKNVKYAEAPLHVALVVHPIEPGQSNFQPVIAMSGVSDGKSTAFYMGSPTALEPTSQGAAPVYTPQSGSSGAVDDKNQPLLSRIIALLRAVRQPLMLPEDTDEANFADRLLVAAMQADGSSNRSAGSTYDPPPGSRARPGQIAMSQIQFPNPSAPAAPASPAAVPAAPAVQPQAVTQADLAILMSQLGAAKQTNDLLMAQLTRTEVASRNERALKLVAAGRMSQDFYNTKIVPVLNGFKMSLDANGQVVPSEVDIVLGALEHASPMPMSASPAAPTNPFASLLGTAAPVVAMSNAPTGAVPATNPLAGQPDAMTDDDMVKTLLQNTGY